MSSSTGSIIVALAATGLRRLIFDAVPMQLKLAVTAGIGLFILFIGLVDAGFIAATGMPSPPVGLGAGGLGSIDSVPTVVFVFTLLLTGILVVRKVRGGILIGLVAGTVVAVVIEAIWHLGSAQETSRRVEPVGADAVGFTVRAARPVACRRRSAWTASVASAILAAHHAVVHAGVRELLRCDGHRSPVWPASPDWPTIRGRSRDCARRCSSKARARSSAVPRRRRPTRCSWSQAPASRKARAPVLRTW